MKTIFRHRSLRVAALVVAGCLGSAHALYRSETVRALRIPDGKLTIDGKPDSLWRAAYASGGGAAPIAFDQYGKMVVLQPQSIRNDDPSKYVKNPVKGYELLLAAYDSQALYFFFMVKTKVVSNPKTLNCAAADLWKADAVEIFLDPSTWSADSVQYRSYFTADANSQVFGTSPRSIQVDKPITPRETNYYFRNRLTADRFDLAAHPNGLTVVSANNPADTTLVGVEMKIPFWTASSDFAGGKSLFVSWGFNMYGDTARNDCTTNPLAYRWAKHTVNYDNADEKPPGWLAKDSTHYDPRRSWDGWGQLSLSSEVVENRCRPNIAQGAFDADWDLKNWKQYCQSQTTASQPRGAFRMNLDAAGMPVPSRFRDARGRLSPSFSPAFARPL